MTHRVIQWATGSIGRTCLRAVLDSPDCELAGLYVYTDRKLGRDAGIIARRPVTGVVATNQIGDILALDADLVIHTARLQIPYHRHDNDIELLLRSGKNVITTAGHHYPLTERAELFTDACRAGGTTLFGVGASPGFVGERLALTLASAAFDLDTITIDEVFDASGMTSPDFVFTDYLLKADHHLELAPRDLEIRAGVIRKGTVAATEWRWHVLVDGRPRLTLAIIWTMDPTHPRYATRPHWRIHLTGRPELTVSVDLHDPPDVRTTAGQYLVAGIVMRAIPVVIAAAPGILQPVTFAPYNA